MNIKEKNTELLDVSYFNGKSILTGFTLEPSCSCVTVVCFTYRTFTDVST